MFQMTSAAMVILATVALGAQDAKPSPPPAPRPALVPLKVSLVLSRYNGEKKISSLPYTMWVTANDNGGTRLRMGTSIPVVTTAYGGKDNQEPMESYNYKDVGTNIDCTASSAQDAFKLALTVTDTSVYYADRTDPAGTPTKPSISTRPAFRNFNSTFTILLRDGQTGQYTTATDQVTGEVLKIDATVNVLK